MASLSPGRLVALGVVVGLISTCVQSVGLTLQRKSHILEEEKEEHEPRRAPYRRRRWQIGMLLFLLSNIIGSSIQITTLPLPLLSTLQASGLVFNALLASLILHEPFTRRTALGTLLVAGGAVLISYFSALPEPSHNLDQLLDLLVQPGFLVWFCLTLVLVIAVNSATFFVSHFLPAHRRRGPRLRLLKGMSYGLVSGILSAHALLLAKSAVELLVRTIVDKANQFNRYQSWLLLLAFLVLALSQLYYLHHGLKLVSTSILYPFVFCIYNITAILDGLIYFRQADLLGPLHGALIAVGTAVLLSGVLALSWRLSEDPSLSDDAESPVVERIKVDLPRTALAPGMGFVDEDANDIVVRTPLRSYFDGPTQPAYRDEEDEEDDTGTSQARSQFPGRYRDDPFGVEGEGVIHEDHSNFRPPRRRGTASSARKPGSIGRRDAAAQRRRRSTIKEVQAVWDELRDERNWFPPQRTSGARSGHNSPVTTRFRDEPSADDMGGERSRLLGDHERQSKGDKRRSAPLGSSNNATPDKLDRSAGPKSDTALTRDERIKRTVSWGQVQHARTAEGADAPPSPRDASAPAAAGTHGVVLAYADRVPSLSGASSADAADESARPKQSWMGSVKLDWWRKRRRDNDDG